MSCWLRRHVETDLPLVPAVWSEELTLKPVTYSVEVLPAASHLQWHYLRINLHGNIYSVIKIIRTKLFYNNVTL